MKDVTIDATKGQAVYILYCRASSITIKGSPSRVVIGTPSSLFLIVS